MCSMATSRPETKLWFHHSYIAVQYLQAIVDYMCSATSAATLRSEGVQLLRQAPPCGQHSARQHYGHLQSGGAVSDLADCLGITHDGRLMMRNVPEGAHKLYLPRIHQVCRCYTVGHHEPRCSQCCQGSCTERQKAPLDGLPLNDRVPEVIAVFGHRCFLQCVDILALRRRPAGELQRGPASLLLGKQLVAAKSVQDPLRVGASQPIHLL
jgi:hypothetical protein